MHLQSIIQLTYSLSILLFLLISCNNEDDSPSKKTLEQPPVSTNTLDKPPKIAKVQYLQTRVNNLRVRINPSIQKKGNWVIAMLTENTYWEYTGQKTDFKEEITLRDSMYNKPWYQIKLDTGIVGWIYGGTADFVEEQKQITTPNYNFPHKMGKYLKPNEIRDFVRVKIAYTMAKDAKTLIDIYQNQAPSLQAYVLDGIQKSHPEVIYSGDDTPLEVWKELDSYISFFTVDLLCSECSSTPYLNHKKFLQKAKNTSSTVDDDFFKLMLATTGEFDEGKEHLYILDMCDVCGFSVLGDGTFLTIAKSVTSFEEKYPKEIVALNLKSIISGAKYTACQVSSDAYWYSKSAVLAEIEDILALAKEANWDEKYLNILEKDRATLKTPKGIQFGCQSGNCEPPN
ncbi:MAG: hypothetical protein GY810_05960 [Aureispira sp.]|nr:hypothetical protein [Aureispira sp.]